MYYIYVLAVKNPFCRSFCKPKIVRHMPFFKFAVSGEKKIYLRELIN